METLEPPSGFWTLRTPRPHHQMRTFVSCKTNTLLPLDLCGFICHPANFLFCGFRIGGAPCSSFLPGWFGLRPQHMKDLLLCRESVSDFLMALTAFVNMVLTGSCPKDIAPITSLVAVCWPWIKKSGGLRPIAIGLTLRRLVLKCTSSFTKHRTYIFGIPLSEKKKSMECSYRCWQRPPRVRCMKLRPVVPESGLSGLTWTKWRCMAPESSRTVVASSGNKVTVASASSAASRRGPRATRSSRKPTLRGLKSVRIISDVVLVIGP